MANADNLKPFKKGYDPRREGNGAKPGSKHISTWIQDMLNDPEFEARYLDSSLRLVEAKGPPIKAIVNVAMQKAMAGDQRWADWLAKYGYGQKIDLSGELNLKTSLVQFIGGDGQDSSKDS